jgi:hypothetical protein
MTASSSRRKQQAMHSTAVQHCSSFLDYRPRNRDGVAAVASAGYGATLTAASARFLLQRQ